ncbi:MAG: 3-dehydroquinate synthase [Candidatus Shikimatogenerans sp. JK-2022]|nr:3-dehydroquinate synthase [Candidatus Shikimatogenerans bostrichidophilus]
MLIRIDNIIINNNFIKLNNFLNKPNISKIVILLDNKIKKFCLNILYKYLSKNIKKKITLINISFGEKNKNLKTCIYIWRILIKKKIDKNSIIINLGGGVITDLGGFISSLFKRGIKFINIPTTLLGMVDASIGGKNGINFLKLKNEIGIIKKPINIYINYKFLKTLPDKEIISGFGEILKYGLIYDKKYWNYIKKINIHNIEKIKNKDWKRIIYKAVEIKNKIVKKDPFELLGYRKILNFGHTIGHALESFFLLKKHPITHGEAILLGMICESWISYKKGMLKEKEYKEILSTILKFVKIKIIKKKYFKNILDFIGNDKKNLNNKIYFVLLNKIGASKFNIIINKNLIKKSIINMNNLKN